MASKTDFIFKGVERAEISRIFSMLYSRASNKHAYEWAQLAQFLHERGITVSVNVPRQVVQLSDAEQMAINFHYLWTKFDACFKSADDEYRVKSDWSRLSTLLRENNILRC